MSQISCGRGEARDIQTAFKAARPLSSDTARVAATIKVKRLFMKPKESGNVTLSGLVLFWLLDVSANTPQ